MGVSGGAKRRPLIQRPVTCWPQFGDNIYIIYTPNLGLAITVFDREREQGRFRGSSEGARGSNEGAGGSTEEHGGAAREQGGALWGSAGAQQVGA